MGFNLTRSLAGNVTFFVEQSKMALTASQRVQATRFAEWFFAQSGTQYSITDGPDPPYFLLQSRSHKTWLEVTDIFINNE